MAKLKKVVKKSAKSKVKASKNIKVLQKPKAKVEKISTKVPKLGIPKAPYKQSEFFTILSEQSGVAKKEVKSVVAAIEAIIRVHLVKNGPGQFVLPGLFKMTATTKPATKARQGRNPFTGEEMTIKAKSAHRAVKVRVIKKFKTALE
jgi:nucleoid DNA-binding protein